MASWGGWLALERWNNSISEILDPIHPHLADIILIILFASAGIVWFYDYSRNSEKRKTHSRRLSQAFQIMSKGEFRKKILDKHVFQIPYPYEEYLRYEKLGSLSTPEALDLFMKYGNQHVDEQKDKFWFVDLSDSDESNFTQAYKHLQSYKQIKKQFESALETQIEYDSFCEDNQKAVIVIRDGDLIYDKNNLDPVYQKYHKLWWKNQDMLKTLQKSLEMLSQKLNDGETARGKCELGY